MADRLPLFWFWLHTEEDARKGTRRAAYAGLAVSVGSVVLLVTVGGLDAASLVGTLLEIALLLGLSYGTYRGSRVAAVGLLGLYVAEQIVTRISMGSIGGFIVPVLLCAMFAQGVAGAFSLNRLRQSEDLEDQLAALEAGDPAPRG